MTPWLPCRFPAEAGRDRDKVSRAAEQRLTPPRPAPIEGAGEDSRHALSIPAPLLWGRVRVAALHDLAEPFAPRCSNSLPRRVGGGLLAAEKQATDLGIVEQMVCPAGEREAAGHQHIADVGEGEALLCVLLHQDDGLALAPLQIVEDLEDHVDVARLQPDGG